LLQLLYDGVLRDGSAAKVVSDVYERREGARDDALDALERHCRGVSVSIEEEGVARVLGGEFAWEGKDVVVVGRVGLGRMRGEKVEAEGVDDEEDGAFVRGRERAESRVGVGAGRDGGEGQPTKQEATREEINPDEMKEK